MIRRLLASAAALAAFSTPALADPILVNGNWYAFAYNLESSRGFAAFGCGGMCAATIPGAEPTTDPPWTFTGPAVITVLDLGVRGDRYQLFDFGVSQGLTSVPTNDRDEFSTGCGNNVIADCLADPTYSRGIFVLAAGNHSLTINVVQPALGFHAGAAVFQASSTTVPEPSTLALMTTALLGLGFWRFRKRQEG